MDRSFFQTFTASYGCEEKTKALIEQIRASVRDTEHQLMATRELVADSRAVIRYASRRIDLYPLSQAVALG